MEHLGIPPGAERKREKKKGTTHLWFSVRCPEKQREKRKKRLKGAGEPSVRTERAHVIKMKGCYRNANDIIASVISECSQKTRERKKKNNNNPTNKSPVASIQSLRITK